MRVTSHMTDITPARVIPGPGRRSWTLSLNSSSMRSRSTRAPRDTSSGLRPAVVSSTTAVTVRCTRLMRPAAHRPGAPASGSSSWQAPVPVPQLQLVFFDAAFAGFSIVFEKSPGIAREDGDRHRPRGAAGRPARLPVVRTAMRRAPRRGTHPSSTRRRCRSCRLPGRFRRRSWPPAGRAVPPDAVPLSGGRGPDAYPGYRTTAVKPCGAPVATGLATPAVTVGTPVLRTAGA